MDKIARIRQEVGRLMELNNASMESTKKISRINAAGYYEALVDIENFLDTLSEEPDKSLEEAAEEYTQKMLESWKFDSTGCRPLREPFIAGAEWQASQMPMPEDTVLFQKGVAEGRRLEREDMLGDEISCEIDWYDGPILNYPIDQLCEVLSKMDIDVGDKVRIIVTKKEGRI